MKSVSTLTGVKDVDYGILNRLSDKDLVSFCSINKSANKICGDDNYWRSRTLDKFNYIPYETMINTKKDLNWSQYYISLGNTYKNIRHLYETKGRLDKLIIFLKKYPFVWIRPEYIADAAEDNHMDIISYLTSHEKDLNVSAAILRAATKGHIDIMTNLLEYYQNSEDFDSNKYYGLLRNIIVMASRENHPDVIRYVLSLNIIEPNSLIGPLIGAAKHGQTDIIKILDDAGVDIHGGKFPDEALRWAGYYGWLDTVKYLISRGANPEVLTKLKTNISSQIREYLQDLEH